MSNFELHYYKDIYCREYISTVVSCTKVNDAYEVILDDTIFYPEGGGQSCDLGYLDDSEVFDVQERGDTVIHYCRSELPVGKKVKGVIDWDRRYDNMQNHSGEHIVSGLIHQKYGYENVGFHMGEVILIDFNGYLSFEQALEIEEMANKVVESNVDTISLYPNSEELKNIDYRSKKELKGQVRLVQIPTADMCACCGTHVRKTGEIGYIKVLSAEKHKNGTRLQILSGARCRKYMNELYLQNRSISNLLSAPMLKTGTYVSDLHEKSLKLQSELNRFKEQYLLSKIDELPDDQKLCLQIISGFDRMTYTRFANALLEKGKGKVVGILNENENGYEYLFMSRDVNLREYAGKINERLNGRGGGKNDIIQGFLKTDEQTAREILNSIFEEVKDE